MEMLFCKGGRIHLKTVWFCALFLLYKDPASWAAKSSVFHSLWHPVGWLQHLPEVTAQTHLSEGRARPWFFPCNALTLCSFWKMDTVPYVWSLFCPKVCRGSLSRVYCGLHKESTKVLSASGWQNSSLNPVSHLWLRHVWPCEPPSAV